MNSTATRTDSWAHNYRLGAPARTVGRIMWYLLKSNGLFPSNYVKAALDILEEKRHQLIREGKG